MVRGNTQTRKHTDSGQLKTTCRSTEYLCIVLYRELNHATNGIKLYGRNFTIFSFVPPIDANEYAVSCFQHK